jgi:hypothetical protein
MSDPTKQSKIRVYTEEQKKRKRELRLSKPVKPLTDEQKQARKIINQRYYQKKKHRRKCTKANMTEEQIKQHRLRNTHAKMTEKQIETHRKRNINENMSLTAIYKHRLRVRDPKSFDRRGNQCKYLQIFVTNDNYIIFNQKKYIFIQFPTLQAKFCLQTFIVINC